MPAKSSAACVRRSLTAAALAMACLLTGACNTIHGLGKDIEKGGQKLQETSAPETKKQAW